MAMKIVAAISRNTYFLACDGHGHMALLLDVVAFPGLAVPRLVRFVSETRLELYSVEPYLRLYRCVLPVQPHLSFVIIAHSSSDKRDFLRCQAIHRDLAV